MSKSAKKSNEKNHYVSKAANAAKIETLIEHGRKEITTKNQLKKFAIGSLVSYMNKDDIIKSGGFITKFADEYFIYVTPDFNAKYRVRYINITKMWVGNAYKVKGDIINLIKTDQKKTNFPARIGDITVFYSKKAYHLKRYMNTDRFKRTVRWYNYFVDADFKPGK